MGLLMRPRRPLLRAAAGAATAGIAYHQGKKRAQQDEYNEPASAAYAAAAAPQPAPAAPAGSTGELERLARLHESGALTDAEFGAAKSQLLGV
jgi:hypothetical protein